MEQSLSTQNNSQFREPKTAIRFGSNNIRERLISDINSETSRSPTSIFSSVSHWHACPFGFLDANASCNTACSTFGTRCDGVNLVRSGNKHSYTAFQLLFEFNLFCFGPPPDWDFPKATLVFFFFLSLVHEEFFPPAKKNLRRKISN